MAINHTHIAAGEGLGAGFRVGFRSNPDMKKRDNNPHHRPIATLSNPTLACGSVALNMSDCRCPGGGK
jgi:hypothetical protein